MSNIANKLLRINTAKQNIKQAIIDKGVDLTGITFENYHTKIAEITGGGGTPTPQMNYFMQLANFYSELNRTDEFAEAWQLKEQAETILYDIPITRTAENQSFGSFGNFDVYSGNFTQLWNDMNNHTLLYRHFDFCDSGPDGNECSPNTQNGVYILDTSVIWFIDYSDQTGITPTYLFTDYNSVVYVFVDGINFGLGSGPVLLTVPQTEAISKFTLKEGYVVDFQNKKGIILPEYITTVVLGGFFWWASRQTLILPSLITYMGDGAFNGWGDLKDLIMLAETPPEIGIDTFTGHHDDLVIKVPTQSVNAYKQATNWSQYADIIEAI